MHGADRSRRLGCPKGKNRLGGSAWQTGDLGQESHLQVFEQETIFFFLTESEQAQINYKVLNVFKE